MKRVLTAVVLIPLVLLAVFIAPIWVLGFLVGLIILVTLHEYLGIIEGYGVEPVRWPLYILSILLVFERVVSLWVRSDPSARNFHYYPEGFLNWTVLLLLPLIFGIPVVFRRDLGMALMASAASAFGILYLAFPLFLLLSMRSTPDQGVLIVFVLFSVWAGDIAAYYTGRSIGRHKLAPIVSPNKTWEGAIASLVASIVVAVLVFHFHQQINSLFRPFAGYGLSPYPLSQGMMRPAWFHGVSLGIVTNVAAQFGDLFESALKRGAQVKDSGTLLPGHGGVLDRIDALLFAIPVVWYYAFLTGFLLRPSFLIE